MLRPRAKQPVSIYLLKHPSHQVFTEVFTGMPAQQLLQNLDEPPVAPAPLSELKGEASGDLCMDALSLFPRVESMCSRLLGGFGLASAAVLIEVTCGVADCDDLWHLRFGLRPNHKYPSTQFAEALQRLRRRL